MIEFKQIVGRGTRTFEGKDFFTVYDFVKAYEHFNDPEWDGEPLPPDDPKPPRVPSTPTSVGPGDPPEPGTEPEAKIVVKLADGKERQIKYIATTTYFSHDGKMISGEEFMQQLFGDLGDLVRDEDHLREIWSNPESRVSFFKVLADRGYDGDRLEDMQRLIDAPNSDVFDVLAYVRFTLAPLERTERAEKARNAGLKEVDGEMRSFLEAVLAAYEVHGVDELALSKIGDFLKVKYGGTNGAKRVLGGIPAIRQAFVDIQTHLYLG
jgi:type I restriction enzyme R subunit